MDLKEILSVSGKAGLYKVVGQTKSGVIGESLIDKKRLPIFAADKMSSLDDIRIFSEDGDVLLKDVFKKIFEKENGGKTAIDASANNQQLKDYMTAVMPDYDKERVYVSDIKKLINWYNLLLENELLQFEDEQTEEPGSEDKEDKKEEDVKSQGDDTSEKDDKASTKK